MPNLERRQLTTGLAIPMVENDVDTDRIIPARFMKCVTFEGIGAYAFFDVRFTESGAEKPHPFNDARFKKGSILITGKNFGCGSSREHAPQALLKYGINAVIGESFAEIFAGNCTVLGIPCVTLAHDAIIDLAESIQQNPTTEVTIDLVSKTITAGEKVWSLGIKETYRKSLVGGTWDSTAELLLNHDQIQATALSLPYMRGY